MGYDLNKIKAKRAVKYEVIITALRNGMSIKDAVILAKNNNIKASENTIRNLRREFVEF